MQIGSSGKTVIGKVVPLEEHVEKQIRKYLTVKSRLLRRIQNLKPDKTSA